MRRESNRLRWMGLLLGTMLALTGCDDDGGDMDGGTDAGPGPTDSGPADSGPGPDDAGPTDAGPTAQGQIRVWHLAAGAGNVDVFIDGEAALTAFEFEQNTDYIDLDAGMHDIAVAPAGMGIDMAVIEVDGFALGEGEQWTIIAQQLNADATAAGAFSALPIQEDTSAPASGSIAFRIFHAAYDVPTAVDVHNLNNATLPEIADGIAQGTVAAARLEVPNAAYGLGLDADDDGAVDLITEMPIDMPTDGATITIGAISKPGEEAGETETELVFLVNAGANIHDEMELEAAEVGFLRWWHLAAEAGNVDIYIDGDAVAMDVPFEANTAYAQVLAGNHDLAITAPGGDPATEAVISADAFAVADGQSFTIIAQQLNADATASGAFSALPILEDRTAPASGSIRFRVFHAAYQVSDAVAIHNVNGSDNPEIVAAIAQGAVAPSFLEVANGAYTLGLDVGDDGTINLQTSTDGTTAGAIDMPTDGALITIGAISKPDGAEEETELVFLVNDGAMIHDEIGLIAF